MDNSLDSNVAGKLTRLYILALTAVAFLTFLGQMLIQYSIKDQLSDSWIINYAGRQRFQSQQIVKFILILTDNKEDANATQLLTQLDSVLYSWQKYHQELKNGDLKELHIRIQNSDTIQQMFRRLEPHYQALSTHAEKIKRTIENPSIHASDSVEKSLNEILAHEATFLKEMDNIVFQYDREAKAKVKALQKVEVYLLGATLFILFLEGIFIFRPAVGQIRKTIHKLTESEAQVRQINGELIIANLSLRKAEEELLKATRQKYQQAIQEQKVRSASLIEGQEEERKRIAREIHDGLGQMLTALKINVENVSSGGPFSEKEQKLLNDQKNLISQTISEARTISFNLMPVVLSDFGIASALKLLTEQSAKNTEVNLSYKTQWNEERLDKNIEIGLYRIAQEGINNAIKYAQATQLTVKLSSKNGYIHLHIIDNGKGFYYRNTKKKAEKNEKTNGITNMQARANMLDGHLKITTGPGKGTKIHIQVPIKYHYHEKDKSLISG